MPPYAFHLHALGEEIAHNALLQERMLDALARTWRCWPGKFWVSGVQVYRWDHEAKVPLEVQMTLHFECKGEVWTRDLLDCCPEDHTEQALFAAAAHFLGLPCVYK